MKRLKLFMCIFLIIISLTSFSQKELKLDEIFNRFGARKGSTMTVVQKSEINNIQIHLYKSLIMSCDESELQYVLNILDECKTESSKIKEVISDGKVVNGYYYYMPIAGSPYNRFLLFNLLNENECVFIYMESKISSDEMIELLK